jgi:hypothetical protein
MHAIHQALAGSLIAAVLGSQSLAAQAEIVADLPDVIVCSVKDPTGTLAWEQLVYYVSARMTDGRTLYKTLTSDPVVLMVSADGVVDGANLADCDGRSVASLRAEGRAFSLTRADPGA